MNFEWSQDYYIGIPEIDTQHKRFLSLIKSLFNEKDSLQELKILDEIYNYSVFHFISEEKLMEIYNYPELEEQKDKHRLLQLELSGFISPVLKREWNKAIFLNFLIKWFVQHTTMEDKEFAHFICKKRTNIEE